MNHFEQAVDALDAAIFGGDELLELENRLLLDSMLMRWQTKMKEFAMLSAQLAEESGE